MRPTLSDVARESGYPVLTCWLAFRPRPLLGVRVGIGTGLRILETAEILGYLPGGAA